MALLDILLECFRSELPAREDILSREETFCKQDPDRLSWILSNVYLCEGSLEDLKQHPKIDSSNEYFVSYYQAPPGKDGPCKRILASYFLDSDKGKTQKLVEEKLKLELHNRGCNAGVFFKTYEKRNSLYAEAVPAVISIGL